MFRRLSLCPRLLSPSACLASQDNNNSRLDEIEFAHQLPAAAPLRAVRQRLSLAAAVASADTVGELCFQPDTRVRLKWRINNIPRVALR